MDGGHRAVHIGVVDGGNGVALGARDEVVLNNADAAHVPDVAILRRLQRHVLGAHLHSTQALPSALLRNGLPSSMLKAEPGPALYVLLRHSNSRAAQAFRMKQCAIVVHPHQIGICMGNITKEEGSLIQDALQFHCL